jgi:engulfment/cell motility protein 1
MPPSPSATSPSSSTSTLKDLHVPPRRLSNTRITIHGSHASAPNKEVILLTLTPQSHSLASEWLDGLLMLLNQQPITADTTKLIDLISNYGLKIRLLNVRFDDQLQGTGSAHDPVEPEIPTRGGLDEDYFYSVFG